MPGPDRPITPVYGEDLKIGEDQLGAILPPALLNFGEETAPRGWNARAAQSAATLIAKGSAKFLGLYEKFGQSIDELEGHQATARNRGIEQINRGMQQLPGLGTTPDYNVIFDAWIKFKGVDAIRAEVRERATRLALAERQVEAQEDDVALRRRAQSFAERRAGQEDTLQREYHKILREQMVPAFQRELETLYPQEQLAEMAPEELMAATAKLGAMRAYSAAYGQAFGAVRASQAAGGEGQANPWATAGGVSVLGTQIGKLLESNGYRPFNWRGQPREGELQRLADGDPVLKLYLDALRTVTGKSLLDAGVSEEDQDQLDGALEDAGLPSIFEQGLNELTSMFGFFGVTPAFQGEVDAAIEGAGAPNRELADDITNQYSMNSR